MTIPTKEQVEQFEKFWTVVWRKVGKLDAERKFIQALKRESAQFITEAAQAYAESVRDKKDRSWLPHPATWLHKGRYYDELEKPEFDAAAYLKQKREDDENTRVH